MIEIIKYVAIGFALVAVVVFVKYVINKNN